MLKPIVESINLKIKKACIWKVFLIYSMFKTYIDISGTYPIDVLILEEARVRAGAKLLLIACHKAPASPWTHTVTSSYLKRRLNLALGCSAPPT
jgi:hypothetical protein